IVAERSRYRRLLTHLRPAHICRAICVPVLLTSRMRPDQKARPSERRIGAASNRGDPARDKCLFGGSHELRRPEIGDDRPHRVESRKLTELRARRCRLHVEELVEPRRAGDDDAMLWTLVELDGLT